MPWFGQYGMVAFVNFLDQFRLRSAASTTSFTTEKYRQSR